MPSTIYIMSRTSVAGRAVCTTSAGVYRHIRATGSPTTVFQQAAPTVQSVIGALSNVTKDPAGALGEAGGATGVGKQFKAANETLTKATYTSCGMCPDSLVNIIASEVREVTEMVLRVKRIVRLLNKLLEEAEDIVLEMINAFIDLIPYPPILDLRELVRTLMCPLLPQAFIIKSYQTGVVAAHRQASNMVPLGSLNPSYYPVFLANTTKYSIQAGADILAGAKDAVVALFQQWKAQWIRMGEELWRRFSEFLDTEDPFTDFGKGGTPSSKGTARSGSGASEGKFLRVTNLDDVVNPTEGMVVYVETTVQPSKLSSPTVERPASGTTTSVNRQPGSGLSYEDQFAADTANSLVQSRMRYVFRDGRWKQLSDSTAKRLVKLLFRMLMEFYGVVRNVGYFTCRASVTKASVALVRATCPSVYDNPAYPFKAYDEVTRDFKMMGFTPSGLGSSSKPFVDAGMRLMLKIEGWFASAYIVVV